MLTFNNTYFFLILMFFFLVFSSCRDKCKDLELTEEEENFIPYNEGEKIVFKNDVTGQLDTLQTRYIWPEHDYSMAECSKTKTGMNIEFSFTYNGNGGIYIRHKQNPFIRYEKGSGFGISSSGAVCTFLLEETTTMIINNKVYRDIYSVSVDSAKIDSAYKDVVPWKIDYSKSYGFIRLYKINGDTFTKL